MHVNSLRCFDFSERTKSASGRSLKRFLQQSIIPYQELLGNYNHPHAPLAVVHIIPYQELLGNYNLTVTMHIQTVIIPYQELLGNYNTIYNFVRIVSIIPYQELLGNYNYAGLQMKTVIIIPYQELFRRGALFRFSARLRYTRCCHKGTRLFRAPSPALERLKNA